MNRSQTRMPPRIGSTSRGSTVAWLLVAGVALAFACVLFLFNPQEHGFYPFCLFHRVTGLLCPGCGCLRATHELLHGNLAMAFRLNPLYVIALPLIIYALWRSVTARKRNQIAIPPHPWTIWGCMTVIILFGILRNLPALREFAAFTP